MAVCTKDVSLQKGHKGRIGREGPRISTASRMEGSGGDVNMGRTVGSTRQASEAGEPILLRRAHCSLVSFPEHINQRDFSTPTHCYLVNKIGHT
jgi:hypothetical protein